jgi:Crossover junction endodeoxyribonuclease RuvC
MAKVLGFDVSSKTVGWCVLEIDNCNVTYVTSGYFSPIKKGSIFEKLKYTREKAKEIIDLHKPDHIAIEDIAKFMPKISSAQTIITLALYNRTIGMAAFEYLMAKDNTQPELFNVMQIRHGLKLTKELPKKDEIPELVASRLKIKFPYHYDKKARIAEESYDEADGVAVALYLSLILTGNIKRKKEKVKKKKNAKK